MEFTEGKTIIYHEFQGILSFVGDNYVVIEIAGSPNRKPARVLIYRHNFDSIQVLE